MEVLLEDIQTPEKGYKIERFEMDTPYKSDEKLFGFIIYLRKFSRLCSPDPKFTGTDSQCRFLSSKAILTRNAADER